VDDQKVVPKKVATKVVAIKIDMHIVAERSSASKEVVASKKAVQDIQMEDVKDVTHSRVIEDALPAEFAHGMSSSHPNHSFRLTLTQLRHLSPSTRTPTLNLKRSAAPLRSASRRPRTALHKRSLPLLLKLKL
jgi:hypothetical protein